MTGRERLREVVRLTGLEKDELAARVGVSKTYIGMMLNGRRRVTEPVLRAAEELACSRVKELLVVLLTDTRRQTA